MGWRTEAGEEALQCYRTHILCNWDICAYSTCNPSVTAVSSPSMVQHAGISLLELQLALEGWGSGLSAGSSAHHSFRVLPMCVA